jgi:hypothetical protein
VPAGGEVAETAADAAKQALASKKISSKINYSVLDDLFRSDQVKVTSAAEPASSRTKLNFTSHESQSGWNGKDGGEEFAAAEWETAGDDYYNYDDE